MKKERGFVGLITLLITMALIALIVWRTDLFNSTNSSNSSEVDTESNRPKSMIERDLDAVQSAKDAKALLEMQSRNRAEEYDGI